MFGLFAARIKSAKEPFIQSVLFRNKKYSLGLTISFLVSGLGYSIPSLTPLVLAEVHHLAPGLIGLTMVPAAFLGRKGGKLADSKGNSVLFYLAITLLRICFILLSSLTGTSPIFIGFILIFGQVGQMYMNIAMSNTISQILPKEQSGVGMGLVSLVIFIGSSFSPGVYSKLVDLGNPAGLYPETNIYSNIYFFIALLYVCIFILFYCHFSKTVFRNKAADIQ